MFVKIAFVRASKKFSSGHISSMLTFVRVENRVIACSLWLLGSLVKSVISLRDFLYTLYFTARSHKKRFVFLSWAWLCCLRSSVLFRILSFGRINCHDGSISNSSSIRISIFNFGLRLFNLLRSHIDPPLIKILLLFKCKAL